MNPVQKTPEEIALYLSKKDPILAQVIKSVGVLPRTHNADYFIALTESIVSQQLSVKVADVIFARFVSLFPNKKITPEKVLEIDTEVMRGVGMSYAKVKYVKSIATHVIDSPLLFEKFDEMSNEDIIATLIQINGVGRWTAEMFLLFTMGREDIFSYGDLGLRNAMKKLYNLETVTPETSESIVSQWIPFRSFASRYLWKSLEM